MTTETTKHVSRVTMRAYSSRIIGSKARKIVVTIAGDNIILRLQGTRQCEYVQIVDAFERARSRRVLSERCTKINAKRRSKT